MKKLLSLLLVTVLLFSLAMIVGCDSETADNTPDNNSPTASPSDNPTGTASPGNGEITQEMLLNSKPGEYMLEKIAAGMDVYVGFAAIADNFFTNEILGEGVRSYVESRGFKYSFIGAEENTATQISQVENYIQMGTSIIVMLPIDADIVRDVVLKAQDEGIFVVLFGISCDYDTIVATFDQKEIGTQIALMALAWMDMVYPDAPAGSIEAAAFGQSAIADVILRTEAVKDTLKSDPRINLVYTTDSGFDDVSEGFTRMEEAFTISKDIKIVCTNNIGSAIGANNYLLTRDDVDLSTVGVFCTGFDNSVPELLELAANNQGCFRGTIQDGENSYDGTVGCIKGIIDGEITIPYTFYQPMFAKTEANFPYDYDSRD